MAHRPTMASEDDLREQFPREPDLRLQNLSQTLQRALTADQEMHDDPDSASGQACRTIDRVCVTQIETAGLGIDYHGDRVAPTVAAWIQLSGSARLQQGDNAAELTAGDLCLLRGARPLSLQLPGAASLMLVEVPEQELVDRFRHWRHALLKPVQASSGAPAVFQDAVRSVWRWGEELGSEIADGIASAMIDLLGAMICFAVSSSPDCVSRALHQRERVRRIARAQLRNPELSVELIAQAACLSPRQVHRLFADEELSLMRWVWAQRLENCYRELQNSNGTPRSISDIAYAWGFNDQAHFSRAFRKHFGFSPRQVRMRAAAEAVDVRG